MTRITIDVYADTACPYSYVGKRYLDKAMAEWQASHPDDKFDLVWRPFYLHPQAKQSAYSRKWVHASSLGSEKRAERFFAHMEDVGAPLGIAFKWGGKTGSTRASHRLIRLARERDAAVARGEFDPGTATTFQERLLAEIFHGQFEDECDVSDPAFLREVAVRAGLVGTEEEAGEWLERRDVKMMVDAEEKQAREIGISAVPSYIVQGKYSVGGAQEPGVFLDLFDRIQATA